MGVGIGIGIDKVQPILVAPAPLGLFYPPRNVSLPVISGTPADGNQLTASRGVWDARPPETVDYQWKANGIPIGGATNKKYMLNGNSGSTVTVAVTATNSQGSLTVESAGVVIA